MSSVFFKNRKASLVCVAAAVTGAIGVSSLQAQTVAWWRFEEGPSGTQVDDGGFPGATFYPGVADSSGNGNALSVWDEGGAGYIYRTQVAGVSITGTPDANVYSVKNSGGFPAMFTETGGFLQTWTPSAWTVEATFKLENGGYRTIIGRDSQGSVPAGDLNLAAMYFQAVPGNALAIKFSDVSGFWHEAISANDIFTSFDFPSDNDGNTAPWYSMAATSDGSTLSLYLREVDAVGANPWGLIAQTDLTLSGSPDTALTPGTGDGGDWDAGNFSVGRGLYAGGHGDRAWGYLDEVRLTDGALGSSQFLFIVPEPSAATLVLVGLGGLAAAVRRRSRG